MSLKRKRFTDSWREIGASHDNASDWLTNCYAEEHRAYHNEEHITECLIWANKVRLLVERPAELDIALFFHDAIYKPLSVDNEVRSAEMFRELAQDVGIPNETIVRIVELIESTATHDHQWGDLALMNDIDLTILGSSPTRYARYEREIRQEYEMLDDRTYKIGRSRFLREFLDRSYIYRTKNVSIQLEVQARANMNGALLPSRN